MTKGAVSGSAVPSAVHRAGRSFMREEPVAALAPLAFSGFLALSSLTAFPARAASIPDWLAEAAKVPCTAPGKDVPAVVLVSERDTVVSDDGDIQTQQRKAVRILAGSGNNEAFAAVPYLTDTQKVSDFRAFLIRPGGHIKKFGKSDIVDIAASAEDLFNESRIQILSASSEAAAGDVFGAEWTVKGGGAFSQLEWVFQDRLPVLVSRLSLTAPGGFLVTAETFGFSAVKGQKEGNRTVWELQNLPHIPDEPYAPPLTALVPRVAVSWFRSQGDSSTSTRHAAFVSWQAVSRWLYDLSEPQARPEPAIAARANDLTRGLESEREKVEAISRAVQSMGYVSVQLGLGRGGGYRPHLAADVLKKGHGDCKDKATLLHSLLRAAGIQSHLVAIYAGDGSFVREEFPSPQQFNHMIIAIEMKEIPGGAPVVKEGAGGSLVLFDPTDERVPFGDLPYDDRYGWGLIVRAEGGSLVEIPGAPTGGFRTVHAVRGTLQADGRVQAELQVDGSGPSARHLRGLAYTLTPAELARNVEKWLSGPLQNVALEGTRITEARLGVARLETRIQARMQSRGGGGGLFLYRPAFIPWTGLPSLPAGNRTLPVDLPAGVFSSSYEVQLPEGLSVDDVPEPLRLSSPYGDVSMDVTVENGLLSMKHDIRLKRSVVPVKEYESLRSFLAKARDALAAVVVFKKEW